MNHFGFLGVVGILLLGIGLGVSAGTSATTKLMRAEAVKIGVAHYDAKTGKFQWNEGCRK